MNSDTWTETELAYLAGIIDGEGCFCLHSYRDGRFGCQLHIGNTDPRLMLWLTEKFGGSSHLEKRSSAKHKAIWRWYATTDNLDAILQAVTPLLILKKDQAELFKAYRLTLPPMRKQGRSTSKTPTHVRSERGRIHSQLAILNRRGAVA